MDENGFCQATTTIRPEDRERFSAMPGATMAVPEVTSCQLAPGHTGKHHHPVQAVANGAEDDETAWWVLWPDSDGTTYETVVLDFCPESYGHDPDLGEAGMCCRPLGHEGPHSDDNPLIRGTAPAPEYAERLARDAR